MSIPSRRNSITMTLKLTLIVCLLMTVASIPTMTAFGQSSSSAVNGVVTDPV